ncbi:M13 family metallopeptidase [Microbulbifer agarilyticus]|uniref:M13 family metallopeptidase n=1 Tax=Microbulbifer agarilyticus TaxID=260552 RepID=UPI001CD540A0|nr:M13-type metalloendopeptidase [Microbulbifer agarilyticus]MCA0893622.1 peptidase M13 [Microbulbifer agarilyticus]
MKKAFVISTLLLAIAGCEQKVESPQPQTAALKSGINLENMDTSVRPGDDFNAYVNGNWLANTEIPADKATYGSFHILRDQAQEHVRKIIEESAAASHEDGSDQQKVGGLYRSFMDLETRNALGAQPLIESFARIDEVSSHAELAVYFAQANKLGHDLPFTVGQYADFKDPNVYMIYAWQGGLGMPDREYYFKEGEKSEQVRAAYLEHIAKMLTLTGIGSEESSGQVAQHIYDLELTLAAQHMKKEKTRDMVALYNPVALVELPELMPNFNWQGFVATAGITELENLVVTQLDYMRELDTIISETSIDAWKPYLKWSAARHAAPYLDEAIYAQHFDFNSRTLHGVEEPRQLWRRGVNLVNEHLGEVVGKVYVKEHFPPEAKARMQELVANLIKAYEVSIKELEWMGEATKQEALDKLSKFTPKIGYPDKWRDYSALTISGDDLYGNMQRSALFNYAEMLEKQKGPVAKHEWAMTPQTVNAYYNPPLNEIVFPAAILQPPFFNMEADDAVNYGGIGAVIGHEIGHGFDDSGSTFDGNGVLRNWWTEEDKSEFKARTAQLIDQYSAFAPFDDLQINGEFTLGENIGDLGGLSIGLLAYQMSLDGKEAPVLDGFTGEQRVFLGYGQIFQGKYREEAMRNLINTDPHAPSEFRINGAVRNVPEFYSAFGVKEGDALYLDPEQRVKIW